MTNQITALCDKIIELDSKRTGGEWVYDTSKTIIASNNGLSLNIIANLHLPENAEYISIAANHAAKLARALKLVMEKIEPHQDVICRGYECCAYCRTLEGLANDIKDEIDEIFK